MADASAFDLHTQQGGRIINQGAYACIFEPALRCKANTKENIVLASEKDSTLSRISKLTDKDSARTEAIVSKRLHDNPLWKNYFVLTESICEPSATQTDKSFRTCEIDALKEKPLSELRILTMPYMGDVLAMHSFNMNTFDVMQFTKHLLSAGAIMNLCGIVHRDLHLKNIIVDDADIPRIIDFNLAIYNDVRTMNPNVQIAELLIHKHDPALEQVTPDYNIMNAITQKYSVDQAIRGIIKQKPVLRKLQIMFGISSYDMEQSLRQFTRKSKVVRQKNIAEWYRIYWRLIDSWAIGVNLVQLIMRWQLWPAFSETYATHKDTILPVLRKMCAVNPLDRIDCVQALSMLDPDHFIIRRYAREWLAKVKTI